MRSAPTATSFVLVPGNFLGAWSWRPVAELLRAAGATVLVVELPSSADGPEPPGDLYDDARAVRETLDRAAASTVLCGHSYGGAVVTQAGAHPSVRRLVYLAGAVPDVGESLASLAPPPPSPPPSSPPSSDAGADRGADDGEQVRARADGRIELTAESAAHALFHDCAADVRAAALERLRPSNPVTGTQAVTEAAWRTTPSAFVRCRDDRLPELVSAAFRAADPPVAELPTGHCPNWSAPEQVATLLLAQATAD